MEKHHKFHWEINKLHQSNVHSFQSGSGISMEISMDTTLFFRQALARRHLAKKRVAKIRATQMRVGAPADPGAS